LEPGPVPDRHGGLRWCASSQPQAAAIRPKCPTDAGEYVRPYSKGQKNDFRDAEAIAEALQRRDVGTAARREQRNNANEEELSMM